MDRMRLLRLLSAVLVPLGLLLLVLGVFTSDFVATVLGLTTALLGIAFFWVIRQALDAGLDLTAFPVFVMSLVQLGGVLFVFALLTYSLSEIESVSQVVRTGSLPATPLSYIGLLMGVLLGGGVPYLMHRLGEYGQQLSESLPVRLVGFSFTFGTYVLLIVYQPAASLLYAGAYLLSRLVTLLGLFVLSSNQSRA
ncbi:hypothetical protein [Halarchaeum nitratireducens]|nr:hypothetical protein [Halarchaeum nitratireducens]